MTRPMVIYHGNCADGFTAAWAAYKSYAVGGVTCDLFAAHYDKPAPDVRGRDVVILDFAYPLDVMVGMLEEVNSFVWLDHHKSNKPFADWLDSEGVPKNDPESLVTYVFDMNRSGAGIAWDFFHPLNKRPRLVDIVEDRDLWHFKYPSTRDVMAYIFSFDYTIENWNYLETVVEEDVEGVQRLGAAIMRKQDKDVRELLKVVQRDMCIAGHVVPVANLPYTMSSEAGHLMAQGKPFAACYYDTPSGRCFSLRSDAHGFDVSLIANEFGGGGHKHAAGFIVPHEHPLAHL